MIVDGAAFQLAVTGLATVSAAVSAAAAVAALRSTRASRLAVQGDSIARLLGAHAAPELVDSYHRLVERGPLLARRSMGTWCPDTDPSLRDVLADGRRLTSFFLQAEVLRRHGIIGDTIFEDIVLSWGAFGFWAQVWVPFVRRSIREGSLQASIGWAEDLIARFPEPPHPPHW